jgi:tagatose 1,6-diphosphate aldolase
MSSTVRTPGKERGLEACVTERGILAALAIDQRGSLRKALARAAGREPATVSDEDLTAFKAAATRVLTPRASAVLLDPLYGWRAAEGREPGTGLIVAYEKSGYDATDEHRMPTLLPEWSAARLKASGADAVKVLVYYDPESPAEINERKQAFVRRVGEECRRADVAFFLEPVTYSGEGGAGAHDAERKPERVTRSIAEWTRPEYGVDVLKVEVPVDPGWLEPAALSSQRDRVLSAFRQATEASTLPLIFLSAGVDMALFVRSLELAGEAGARFNGVLCGRATWKGGIAAYARGGEPALEAWLGSDGLVNIERLNEALEAHATAL